MYRVHEYEGEIGDIKTDKISLGKRWARVQHVDQSVGESEGRQYYTDRIKITIRYDYKLEDFKPNWYIEFKDKQYLVIDVMNPYFKNDRLEITAEYRGFN